MNKIFVIILFAWSINSLAQSNIQIQILKMEGRDVKFEKNKDGKCDLQWNDYAGNVILHDTSSDFSITTGHLEINGRGYSGHAKYSVDNSNNSGWQKYNWPKCIGKSNMAVWRLVSSRVLIQGPLIIKYTNGQIAAKYSYLNGMNEGKCVDYNVDGKIVQELRYSKGQLNGTSIFYNYDELLYKTEETYNMGTLLIDRKYDQQNILRYESSPDQHTLKWHSNRKLKSSIIKDIWFYKYSEYDTSGNLIVTGTYSDYFQSDSINTWKWYDSKGKLIKKKTFKVLVDEEPEEIEEIFMLYMFFTKPEYLGGMHNLHKMYNEYIKPGRRDKGVIEVQFKVMKDGRTREVKIVRSDPKISSEVRSNTVYFFMNKARFKPAQYRDRNLESTMNAIITVN